MSCIGLLYYGLVFLRCWLVSIGYKSIVLNVLSRSGNAIDSGTGKPGAVTGCPEGIPPEGDGGAAQAR